MQLKSTFEQSKEAKIPITYKEPANLLSYYDVTHLAHANSFDCSNAADTHFSLLDGFEQVVIRNALVYNVILTIDLHVIEWRIHPQFPAGVRLHRAHRLLLTGRARRALLC